MSATRPITGVRVPARFDLDGSLDTSFDTDGRLTTSFGPGQEVVGRQHLRSLPDRRVPCRGGGR